MQFYKVDAMFEEKNQPRDRKVQQNIHQTLAEQMEEINEALGDDAYAYPYQCTKESVRYGVIVREADEIEKVVGTILTDSSVEFPECYYEETDFRQINRSMIREERAGRLDDVNTVLSHFSLDSLAHGFGISFAEGLYKAKKNKEEIAQLYRNHQTKGDLDREIDRIMETEKVTLVKGHPVHYMLFAGSEQVKKDSTEALLAALYQVGRIDNRRYSIACFCSGSRFDVNDLKALYEMNKGGTVVLDFDSENAERESDLAGGSAHIIEVLCKTMKEFRKDVLTVFWLPRESAYIKTLFFSNLANVSLIEINEAPADSKEARKYLKELTEKDEIRGNKKLYAGIKEDRRYPVSELNEIYTTWYEDALKRTVYPQYRNIESIKSKIVNEPMRGNALQELNEMIGLADAKKVLSDALKYYRAQQLYKERGIFRNKPSMHMVFTGNPGTAKTSVARLFARILRDNNVLSSGHMVECGRADLVGQFVGWTAKAVQDKFKEAQGGVLFIDEAYSLVDDRNGSYGDEAINTIVQEMENHRDNVIVIFAGYPKEMESFMNKNPGLRSRIAYHVNFSDYTVDELVDISKLIANKNSVTVSCSAENRLHELFVNAKTESDFGNGRYARNLIEQAAVRHGARILDMDYEHMSDKELTELTAEDFPAVAVKNKIVKHFGFGVA